ncbi:MAG TPA: UPF0182 family protein [Pyrinomonadaceae bacterium]|jgi:hypothetical protein
MSTANDGAPQDLIIDVGPPRRARRWRIWTAVALVLLALFVLPRLLSVYIDALWFGSVGYAPVYWYGLRFEITLFVAVAAATFIVLRAAFYLLARRFGPLVAAERQIVINNQPVDVAPARVLRPLGWLASIGFALAYGFALSSEWQTFALWLHAPATGTPDPVFHRPLSFYLFALPVYELLSGWLTTVAFIVLVAAGVYALATLPDKGTQAATRAAQQTRYAAASIAFALLLLALAWATVLARYPYLWDEHQTFSGVTYTEDHFVLPGLLIVAGALVVAALVALVNAFTRRGRRLLIAAAALPLVVYIVAVLLVPTYVQSFVVKPNELERETPYIEQNIAWTRAAFQLERVAVRDFEADSSPAAYALDANRTTLDNIRLWDRVALQATLTQIQEIRNYYSFAEVDVDRYTVGGQQRQVMIGARELDVNALPESSRNWINQRLIYTHGYGVTMNTANGFTAEGRPEFILSNMPVESAAPEIKLTRPQIYFGSKTDTDVYVNTRQKEFDYPQGDTNSYTIYEGTGGIRVGSGLRRLALGWALDDLSKLPFSDDVTADSRVLMRRNLLARTQALAPYLIYDNDPFIVVGADGRLVWMLDAYTATDRYPYARHVEAEQQRVNYLRNSVKVTIDAYNGDVQFYVFDEQDPLLAAYRNIFPTLFRPAAQMPADLRAHVRYPDALIQTQGASYGLYHTTNAKVFFQREDVWTLANIVAPEENNKDAQPQPLRPYFALMRLPGYEQTGPEFIRVVLFTPASRNNLIGWMAGRSDGDNYGSLVVYGFPKSRLIDGPLQIEARIDQDPQLSGQFTLWNQQGSRIERGNLMALPIGRGLLYVQPIYLQAVRSPMPELRLVVVATHERLAFGPNFAAALAGLFGQPPAQPTDQQAARQDTTGQPAEMAAPPAPGDTQQLIERANQQFNDYQRLTSEGKLGEAGQKLEALKRTLSDLQKAGGAGPAKPTDANQP